MDDDQTYPDLMFVDIHMPGMNGFEFLEHCRRAGCLEETEVVLLSHSIRPEDRHMAEALGINHLIKKPLTREKLHRLVQSKAGVK